MLRSTAARLGRELSDDVLRNAVAESFLLHARSLAEFFSQTGFADRDVRASRYVGRPWALGTGLDVAPVLQQLQDVSWDLAHITVERNVFRWGRSWDMNEICDALKLHVDRFADLTGWEPYPVSGPPLAKRAIRGPAYSMSTTAPVHPTDMRLATAHVVDRRRLGPSRCRETWPMRSRSRPIRSLLPRRPAGSRINREGDRRQPAVGSPLPRLIALRWPRMTVARPPNSAGCSRVAFC
jgi:hypothetical protein